MLWHTASVSPRPADATARSRLLDAAARLLAEEGPAGLTVRRLGAEIGTSSMAVYTQFGGMDGLRSGVRIEGFRRLAEHLSGVPALDDPVAELAAIGFAYCANAIEYPNLYRVMFLDAEVDAVEAAAGTATFDRMRAAVERCIATGRFRPADAEQLAIRLWATAHGFVSLELAGLLTAEECVAHLVAIAVDLAVGFGDLPERAGHSVAAGHSTMERRHAASTLGA
jgi:AcrR family transcriptional regulator